MEYKKKYKFEESKNLDTLISKRLNGSNLSYTYCG